MFLGFALSIRWLHCTSLRTRSSALFPKSRCSLELFLPSPAHTEALGAALAASARRGDAILLHGELGCGKTSLARGYIRRFCKNPDLNVTSPTYLLSNCYSDETGNSQVSVYHIDLWRLHSMEERAPFVDFDKVFAEEVSLIEWPDRLGSGLTPSSRLDVFLRYPPAHDAETPEDDWGFPSEEQGDAAGRYATLVPHGALWESRVEALRSKTTVSDSPGMKQARTLGPG